MLFYLNAAGQFLIYQNASAVLTYHYFLMLFYLALFLRRDSIETATTGIPFHGDHCQSVTITFADLLIAGEQPAVNM